MRKFITYILLWNSLTQAGDLVSGINSALKYNNIYNATIANKNAYAAQSDIAIDALKPSLMANSTLKRENYNANGNGISNEDTFVGNKVQIQIKQKIFDMYAYETYQKTNIEYDKANTDLLAAEQDLLANVTFSYLEVLKSHALYKAAISQTKALSVQLKYDQAKFSAGTITNADLLETTSHHDTAFAYEIAMKNNFIDSIDKYMADTQLSTANFKDIDPEIKITNSDKRNINDKIDLLKRYNLSLKSANLTTESADKEIAISQSGHLPELTLVGSYQDSHNPNSVITSIMNTEDTKIKKIELELNLPIYQGGIVNDQIKQSEYIYEKSLANTAQTQAELIKSLRKTHHHIQNGIKQLQALKSAVTSSSISLRAQKEGYKAGTRTNLEVLSAINKLRSAESDYAVAKYDFIKNTIQEKKLIGSLSLKDIEKLDKELTIPLRIPKEAF